MRASGRINASFPDERSAEGALRALKGEAEASRRVNSRVFREGKELVVEAEGTDIVALRATLNAYLRYLQTMEGINGE
jgi:tRNA threonylcarbamoyladenosine modification (KEOPS) complex  Pcc1 subunit